MQKPSQGWRFRFLTPKISKLALILLAVFASLTVHTGNFTVHAETRSNRAGGGNVAPLKPSASCPQPDPLQNISTLTLQERLDQGYPLPIKGQTDPSVDQIIHDKGEHFCADTDIPGTFHTSVNPASVNPASVNPASVNPASVNPASVNPAEYDNRIWSGYYATSALIYTFVQAHWIESCMAQGTNDRYATWVGIGGIDNNNLVQAGTEGDNRNLLNRNKYVAWVENTQNNGPEVIVFNINCGDQMYAEVGIANCMLVADLTSGASSGWRCSGPNANPSTAECVVEAPTDDSGSTYNLSNYGTLQFTGCDVEIDGGTGSNLGINDVPNDSIDMYNGNTLLSSPGPITNNDTFTVTWHNYS